MFTTMLGRSQQTNSTSEPAPTHVVPLKTFPKDQRFEAVSGDIKKAGEVYVIRIHSEAGYIVMPHFHPEDEHIVIVKGSWHWEWVRGLIQVRWKSWMLVPTGWSPRRWRTSPAREPMRLCRSTE